MNRHVTSDDTVLHDSKKTSLRLTINIPFILSLKNILLSCFIGTLIIISALEIKFVLSNNANNMDIADATIYSVLLMGALGALVWFNAGLIKKLRKNLRFISYANILATIIFMFLAFYLMWVKQRHNDQITIAVIILSVLIISLMQLSFILPLISANQKTNLLIDATVIIILITGFLFTKNLVNMSLNPNQTNNNLLTSPTNIFAILDIAGTILAIYFGKLRRANVS